MISRYRYILDLPIGAPAQGPKLVGVFPFNSLVDMDKSDLSNGKMEFYETAVKGLTKLAQSNTNVVLFINQFKRNPLPFEQFSALNQAIEGFINQTGVQVLGIYWCPSTDKNDPFVVPNPGMFRRASENQHIVWDNIPVISTSENDLAAANKVKALPVKVGTETSKWSRFDSFLDWVNSYQ